MSNSGDIRGGRVWARMVSYIIRRDPVCKLKLEGCTGKSETADHIIAVEAGGTNQPNNLQGTCKACNWKRGKKPLEEVLGAQGGAQSVPDVSEDVPPEIDSEIGTRIVFDGADKPSHRVLLEGMGVTRFGFSFWRAWRRGFPKTKPYMLTEYFGDDAEIFVDSGWLQAEENLEDEELLEYAEAYETFLGNNLWRISGATEMNIISNSWIDEWREAHKADMGSSIWPVWRPERGASELFRLAGEYDDVVIPNKGIEDTVVRTRIGALHRQFGCRFHALNVADPDVLRSVPLTSSSTISWASPQMRGETIVWDGQRLVRYQAKMKKQARLRYKSVVEKAGLDHDKVLADDPNENTRLAIWAYLQLEKSMSVKNPFKSVEGSGDLEEGLIVSNRADEVSALNPANEGGHVDNKGLEVRQTNLTGVRPPATKRAPNQRMNLPVFAVETSDEHEMVDGVPTITTTTKLRSSQQSMRQCNSCVLKDTCPAFQPDHECAFNLPLELRTRDQLKSLLNSIIEIQGQRVAFAKFAEDMNGGYPDPNLSQEIDRLFRLVKNVKDLESNHEFVRMTVERQKSGGVMSAIFGERASAVTQLPAPVDSDAVISQIVSTDS